MTLVAHITLDSATWAALAFVLAVLGAALSWVAWRRRGLAAGLRGLAWTLVPIAAWLTGTLKLAANIINDVLDWAARLVFSPTVWIGVVVAAVAACLWVLSGILRTRGTGARTVKRKAGGGQEIAAPQGTTAPTRSTRRKPADDDPEDMDDIEAILKRHGI